VEHILEIPWRFTALGTLSHSPLIQYKKKSWLDSKTPAGFCERRKISGMQQDKGERAESQRSPESLEISVT